MLKKFVSLDWWKRFIKFNTIGIVPFLIATALFFWLLPVFGVWAWFIVNAIGATTHFLLVEFFNKHKFGFMFHEPQKENS